MSKLMVLHVIYLTLSNGNKELFTFNEALMGLAQKPLYVRTPFFSKIAAFSISINEARFLRKYFIFYLFMYYMNDGELWEMLLSCNGLLMVKVDIYLHQLLNQC